MNPYIPMKIETTCGKVVYCGNGLLEPHLLYHNETFDHLPYSKCWISKGKSLEMRRRYGERTRFIALDGYEIGDVAVKHFGINLKHGPRNPLRNDIMKNAWHELEMLNKAKQYGIDCARPISLVKHLLSAQLFKVNESIEMVSDLPEKKYQDVTARLEAISQSLFRDMGTLASHNMVQTSFTFLTHMTERWKYYGHGSQFMMFFDSDISHTNISIDGKIRDFEHVKEFSSKEKMMIPLAASLTEASVTLASIGVLSSVPVQDIGKMIRSGFRECLQKHKDIAADVGEEDDYSLFAEYLNRSFNTGFVHPDPLITSISHYLQLAGWSLAEQKDNILLEYCFDHRNIISVGKRYKALMKAKAEKETQRLNPSKVNNASI